MSNLNIACLLSPMADTEGPMDIAGGNTLTGSKKIMGKYGEVGLEATITFAEENPNTIHTDILSIGKAKEVTSLQQTAIAMIQPKKHPGTLGVHAVNDDGIDGRDAFEVADMLVAMINKLENKPDLVFAGRESWDYAHGVVGPAVAQKLGMPYYSGVNEVKLNDGMKSVTATFIEGNDKIVYDIPLPAVFGTTDWLNGKDSARFTSLKGVMGAKKFKRNQMEVADLGISASSKTAITAIEVVKSERKNRKVAAEESGAIAAEMIDVLVNQDKALAAGGSGDAAGGAGGSANWAAADAAGLNLAADVVVIADHDHKALRLSTKQAVSQARKIADATGKKVTLLVLAKEAGSIGDSCFGFGVDRVVAATSDLFEHTHVNSAGKAIAQLLGDAPSFVVTIANDLGRDLAASLAARYDAGLLQDVVSLTIDGGKLAGTRVVSNARFITSEKIVADGAQIVSVRATAFDPIESDIQPSFHTVSVSGIDVNAKVAGVTKGEQATGVPLNEAKIIVSGGRGMKDAANFGQLQELANMFGGAMGASRAVTDLDWVPHNLQIGQTGTTVAPDVYFAVGISGAIQHLTGMLGSKYIVAVNPDADAPIHKHADLSVVDKWENVIPAFSQEIKKVLG